MYNVRFAVLLCILLPVVCSFSNDVVLAIGVSVISSFALCFLVAALVWRFCLSSAGARKHQFEISNHLNNNVIVNNYEATNRDACSKCGHHLTTSLDGGDTELQDNGGPSFPSTKEACVVVHNNSRITNNTFNPRTSFEESPTGGIADEDHNSFIIHLTKTESGSLGLSIVGGRNSRLGDIGIFIKSTVENSPAHLCGQIKPWDQILQVNRIPLDGMTIQDALHLLKSQPNTVYLTILPSEIATLKLEGALKTSSVEAEKIPPPQEAPSIQLRLASYDEPDSCHEPELSFPGMSELEISVAETERYLSDSAEDHISGPSDSNISSKRVKHEHFLVRNKHVESESENLFVPGGKSRDVVKQEDVILDEDLHVQSELMSGLAHVQIDKARDCKSARGKLDARADSPTDSINGNSDPESVFDDEHPDLNHLRDLPSGAQDEGRIEFYIKPDIKLKISSNA